MLLKLIFFLRVLLKLVGGVVGGVSDSVIFVFLGELDFWGELVLRGDLGLLFLLLFIFFKILSKLFLVLVRLVL